MQRIRGYLGVLRALEVDAHSIIQPDDDPLDALRLLFQGLPVAADLGGPAVDLARRIQGDPSFRQQLLDAMRRQCGVDDGRAAQANPFIAVALAEMVAAERFAAARGLLVLAGAINRGALWMAPRQAAWCTSHVRALDRLARRKPTLYDNKKREVFRNPGLWRDLVAARTRLRRHTEDLETAWKESRHGASVHAGRTWAIALRNEVIFGLMLCYPLRAGNVVGLEIGRNFDPDRFRIELKPDEVKNDRAICYELPESGSLGDLRGLLRRYINDARPMLLEGRASNHLFVPAPPGGTRFGRAAVNQILANIGERFLADVLPPGVRPLNPHLTRHLAATYHLVERGDTNMAAQLLGDAPSSVMRAYADVLGSTQASTKGWLNGFSLDPPDPSQGAPAILRPPRTPRRAV